MVRIFFKNEGKINTSRQMKTERNYCQQICTMRNVKGNSREREIISDDTQISEIKNVRNTMYR